MRAQTLASAVFISLLTLTLFVFWPGLSGPFLLDDFLHLPNLARNGAVDNMQSLFEFTMSSPNGSGRPLSFLSILINDNSWPSNPFGFKYTNLLIHLLNGVLVFVFARMLGRLFFREPDDALGMRKADLVGLLTMALWVLHPIQLSPTMLVIQRMTLLMGTFSLLGLITYVKGRQISLVNPMRGYLVMSAGMAIFGILGALCKEPAVMMVCYVIALEATLLPHAQIPRPRGWWLWSIVFLILPLAAIAGYFTYRLPKMEQLYLKRDFDMFERLLTQSRVLLDYVKLIIFPNMSEAGPYHDDYSVSRSLLDPPDTLIAIGTILFAAGFAAFRRLKHPVFSFAILWFLLGHLLESTVLPLELYFEHRNYLPMLGIALAFSIWILNSRPSIRKFSYIGAAAFLALESTVTYVSSETWGNRALIANVWSQEHPGSPRAQLDAIKFWLDHGNIPRVRQHFQVATAHNPDNAGLWLYGFTAERCNIGYDVDLGVDLNKLQEIVPTARFDHASLDALRFLADNSGEGRRCNVTPEELIVLTNLYLGNAKFYAINEPRGYIYQVQTELYRRMRDLDGVMRTLDLTYEAAPKFEFPLEQAYLLTAAGRFDEALRYIEKARNTKPYNRYVKLWQYKKIAELETFILARKQSTEDENSARSDTLPQLPRGADLDAERAEEVPPLPGEPGSFATTPTYQPSS
jgi:hypothetical protein